MVAKALLAISLSIGGSFGAGLAHADNVQNLGTYAGDVVKQLQDWGYNVMLTASIGTSPTGMTFKKEIAKFSGSTPW